MSVFKKYFDKAKQETSGKGVREATRIAPDGIRWACPVCEHVISPTDFKDKLSIREFCISGLCQNCQDQVFI